MVDYETTIAEIFQSNTQTIEPMKIFDKLCLSFFYMRHATHVHIRLFLTTLCFPGGGENSYLFQ